MPFRAQKHVVLRIKGSRFKLKDFFENFPCVISTSIALTTCQLPVVNEDIMLVVDWRGKDKVTYFTKSNSMLYWPKCISRRTSSISIELVTTSSKQSKEGASHSLVYFSTSCTVASNGTCGGSSQVMVLVSKKEAIWAKWRNRKNSFLLLFLDSSNVVQIEAGTSSGGDLGFIISYISRFC